jgi:hypothetical protein
MTVEQTLLKYLTEKGLSDNQAKEILTDYLKSIAIDTNYQISLGADKDAYPNAVYIALYSGLQHQALQYIEKNIPMAWFKPMFV